MPRFYFKEEIINYPTDDDQSCKTTYLMLSTLGRDFVAKMVVDLISQIGMPTKITNGVFAKSSIKKYWNSKSHDIFIFEFKHYERDSSNGFNKGTDVVQQNLELLNMIHKYANDLYARINNDHLFKFIITKLMEEKDEENK
jgi:hypothetical protein